MNILSNANTQHRYLGVFEKQRIYFEKFDASSEIRKCVNRDLVRFEPGSINGTEWHPYYTTTRPPMPIYKNYTIRYLNT